MKWLLSVVTVAALSLAGSAYGSIVYDLTDDFSTTLNPNGAWSYRNDGELLPLSDNPWGYVGGGIHKVAGSVITHTITKGEGTYVEIRWTALMAGTIDIEGQVWDAGIEAGRDVGWSLLVNGTEIAADPSIIGQVWAPDGVSFDYAGINVLQGQQVQLLLSTTGTQIYGHFAGIEEKITLTPTGVPEPSTCIAGALLLLPFGIQAVRRVCK